MDTVDVKDPSLDVITSASASNYSRSGNRICGVRAGTSVANFLAGFDNEVLEVVNAAGTTVTGAALVGTGTKVNLYQNGKLVDTVTVVVLGDVNGNGLVNGDDNAMIKSFLRHDRILTDYQTEAADVDGNGIINTTDYIRIRAHILDKFNLYD
jgi:hypothetical protein